MAKNKGNNPYDLDWESVGDPRKRKAMRNQQLAIDAAYRASRNQTAVVTNQDNLETLAAANGTTPDALLAANPDVNSIKTGMVLNVPQNASVWQGHGTTPGTPSAGPLGSTQGYQGAQVNMWQGVTPGYNTLQQPNTPYTNSQNPFTNPYGTNKNPFAPYEYKPPKPSNNPYVRMEETRNALNPPTTQPQQPTMQYRPTFRKKDDYIPTELAALINLSSTRYATPQELAYLEKYGMIVKTPQPAFTGGGGYKRNGGKGGGGGGGVPKVQSQQPSIPAFSTGSGFGGLVNWRI